MSLLWINGALTDKADARVSPFDHGFLYGDGVWEHLRLFNGKPFHAQNHLNDLFATADVAGIDVPLSPDELLAAISATAKANDRTEGYVRVIVTRGPGTIGPDPRKIEPQVIVIVEEYQPFPQELYGHGLHAVVSPLALDPDNVAHQFRTLGQIHVVQAKQHAIQSGCLESLFRSRQDKIVGSTEGAVFAVKDGAVTLALGGLMEATSFAVVTAVARGARRFAQAALALDDLFAADEVFIAGTACGVIGVVRIDGRTIGSGTEGPVTRELRASYQQLTHDETR